MSGLGSLLRLASDNPFCPFVFCMLPWVFAFSLPGQAVLWASCWKGLGNDGVMRRSGGRVQNVRAR